MSIENTQLTKATGYNTENMLFSKPIVSNISNQVSYKRVMISTKNPDGTQGDLIIPTERVFSFGVGTRNPDGDPKDGYQLTLSMHSRDNPTQAELEWIKTFNSIINKCKEHLLSIKDTIGLYELTKEDSLLKSCNPLKYKKDKGKIVEGVPPILGVKLITRKGEIVSMFHDERGNVLDPMSLVKKHCNVVAALKFESIFIGSKLIAIQIKLYEAQVKLLNTGFKSLLVAAPVQQESNQVLLSSSHNPLDDDDEDIPI